MTTNELQQMRREGVTIINVLAPEAHAKKHIPDTVNVPLGADDFPSLVERKVGAKENPVVVYCASIDCDASPKAAERLRSAGFSRVYDCEGGIAAWEKADLPLSGTEA